ncbi:MULTISPECIES: hypothetical protein [unclassified Bacillus (in: firmicutes)]
MVTCLINENNFLYENEKFVLSKDGAKIFINELQNSITK